MHEVLSVLLREEIRDEPDRRGRTEVELRRDRDEVGRQEGDVDCGKDLKLRGRENKRFRVKRCQRESKQYTQRKKDPLTSRLINLITFALSS